MQQEVSGATSHIPAIFKRLENKAFVVVLQGKEAIL